MNGQRPSPQIRVFRGSLPLWAVALLAFPIGLALLASLAVAGFCAAIAAVVLPLFLRRRPRRDADCIELDPADYDTIDGPRRQ
jgi:hypothetical protein